MRTKVSSGLGFEPKEFSLEWIDVGSIDDHELQPGLRTEVRRLQLLREMIEKTRVIIPPIVARKQIGGRFAMLDAHRRKAVAIELGVRRLQCLVVKEISALERIELFMALNTAMRPMLGNERMEVWAAAPSNRHREYVMGAMSQKQRDQIVKASEILGEDRVRTLALKHNALASLGACTEHVVNWMNGRKYETNRDLSKREIAEWIIANRASRLIDTLSRKPEINSIQAVIKCIEHGLEFKGKRR